MRTPFEILSGCSERLGGRVVGTESYVATTEVAALLRHNSGVPIEDIVDSPRRTSVPIEAAFGRNSARRGLYGDRLMFAVT